MMDRYENLGTVGEGSYGIVMKCRHKEYNQIVAIKKFIESEDDQMVRKIAMREIKMLKQLRHENLVNLLEVFRRKKRLYLVFEFMDHTALDELEKRPEGLPDILVKKITYQTLRGLEFCHAHNVIHRDIKPENILISNSGIVKVCDFGFARTLIVGAGEVFTDYVATRWYRAPELLVGDVSYGKAVDIWATGCLLFEMITGDPLFPGDSDIDQLFYITKHLGNLTQRHLEIFQRNPLFSGAHLPPVRNPDRLTKNKTLSTTNRDLIVKSLALEASDRPSCGEMMKHCYFTEGDFELKFLQELKEQIEKETVTNPFLKPLASQKQAKHVAIVNKDVSIAIEKTQKESKKITGSHTATEQAYLTNMPVQQSLLSDVVNEKDLNHKNNSDNTKRRNSNDNKKEPNPKTETSNDAADLSRQYEHHEKNKNVHRTILDVSIRAPGRNLPDIGHSSNNSRAHGYEVMKHKKNHKKHHNKQIDVVLHPMTEKAHLHLDRNKSFEDLKERMKKKDSRKDFNEVVELSKKSSLHFPTVKGLETKQTKLSSSRGGARRFYGMTIPHIQNLDLFSSNPQETPNNSSRSTTRNDNLPAV